MRNKIIIYGGSSLISKYLFFEFYKEDYEFIVFCRDKKKVIVNIESLNLDISRFTIHSLDLEKLDDNFKIIDTLGSEIKGIIWVAGYIGDPNKEIVNLLEHSMIDTLRWLKDNLGEEENWKWGNIHQAEFQQKVLACLIRPTLPGFSPQIFPIRLICVPTIG